MSASMMLTTWCHPMQSQYINTQVTCRFHQDGTDSWHAVRGEDTRSAEHSTVALPVQQAQVQHRCHTVISGGCK